LLITLLLDVAGRYASSTKLLSEFRFIKSVTKKLSCEF